MPAGALASDLRRHWEGVESGPTTILKGQVHSEDTT
jgi:hypothetical protein